MRPRFESAVHEMDTEVEKIHAERFREYTKQVTPRFKSASQRRVVMGRYIEQLEKRRDATEPGSEVHTFYSNLTMSFQSMHDLDVVYGNQKGWIIVACPPQLPICEDRKEATMHMLHAVFSVDNCDDLFKLMLRPNWMVANYWHVESHEEALEAVHRAMDRAGVARTSEGAWTFRGRVLTTMGIITDTVDPYRIHDDTVHDAYKVETGDVGEPVVLFKCDIDGKLITEQRANKKWLGPVRIDGVKPGKGKATQKS